jgi:2-amino-4-hydroxy-6-hydroxymethyldihydropteridine diphosphokinase
MRDRSRGRAFVGVGSNVHPRANIAAAVDVLAARIPLLAVSTFRRTPPLGPRPQPAFINGVVEIAPAAPPRQIKFDILRGVEDALGRTRSEDKHAPRTIDLDLLLFGRTVLDEPGLKLPHDDLRRPWVAAGVLELAPGLVLPGTGEGLSDIIAGVPAERFGRADEELTRALRQRLSHER